MKVARSILTLIAIVLIYVSTVAQSKLYICGSYTTVFSNDASINLGSSSFGVFSNYSVDLEYQRRIMGSISFATGASVFGVGYETDENSFTSISHFKATYLGVPMMLRWNPGNKNFYFIDFGPVPYYLLKAHLEESIDQFGDTKTVRGDITYYSHRFYYALKVQMLVLVSRFQIGFYVFLPFKGQTTLNGLEDHWGLNSQQSIYLISKGFSNYQIMGFKMGLRIR